jgi:hypothetical protein
MYGSGARAAHKTQQDLEAHLTDELSSKKEIIK